MADPLPTSGKVNAFAVSPKNANLIYVASGRGTGLETYSSAGIYRTTNGGTSWVAVNNGLKDASGAISSVVNTLWMDPANPSVLLAATEYDGLFRTTDGGTSWKSVFRTTQATQIVSFGSALYATGAAGILTSTDDGATWNVQLAGTATKFPAAFGYTEGKAGKALFAGMTDGSVYSFPGRAWTFVSKIPFDRNTGTDGSLPGVHQMAVDPLTPSTLYASTNDGQWDQDLHVSTNGGKTWATVLKKVYFQYGLGTQAIAFSTVHPHQLYVGADGGMYYITGSSVNPPAASAANISVIDIRNIWTYPGGSDDLCWIASDQGLDRVPNCSKYSGAPSDRVVSSTVATGLARRFAVTPNGKTVLASLQDFDSHITFNGGSTWYLASGQLYEDGFNELRPGNPNYCYAYDEANGLQVSSDGCASFTAPSGEQGKIFPSRLMTTPIAFDPKTPTTMYVASGDVGGVGFAPAPKAVFKSTDGGVTLTQQKWPLYGPGAVVVDKHAGAHILVGDMQNGQSTILSTFDGGKTWTKSAGVPPTPFWYAITISPVNGQLVLASSMDSSNNVFVLRSTNGGKTFTRVTNVVNTPLLVHGRIHIERRRGHEADDAQAAASPPPAFIYSPEREIRYNQDVTKGTPLVAITTLRGAFVSNDNGSTWTRLDDALISHSFWGIRWVNGYLYLGSDGQGVLRSKAPLQKP